MKINPMGWFRTGQKNQGGALAASTREAQALGPFTGTIGGWVPQQINPWLMEALREAIPILDAAINRLVTFDGILVVEGGNDRITGLIDEWMRNIPVNDAEHTLQAFYTSQGNEVYEQGCTVGEMVFDARGREVVGLRVADSKGIIFVREDSRLRTLYRAPTIQRGRRADGLDSVEALLRRGVRSTTVSGLRGLGFVEVAPEAMVYAVNHPEADGPYGTSVLRSLEFVSQILLKMQNATGRVWERFGDPPFHVHYGTKNRTLGADEVGRRATQIAADLAKALTAKANGNSVDLATGAGADDTIELKVIGAEGEALTIEQPMRHVIEQIVAKLGLPPWSLGLQWSTTGGAAEQQAVVVLQEAQTRFTRREHGLEHIVATHLRGRGITWKPGDWRIKQRLPNLQDEVKKAQAAFLRAQTALMANGTAQGDAVDPGRGVDNNLRTTRRAGGKGTKAADDSDPEHEPWAEEDPELPKIESRTSLAMLAAWRAFGDRVLRLLGLGSPSDGEPFDFDLSQLTGLASEAEAFAVQVAALDGPLTKAQWAAWLRGRANVAGELSVSAAISAQHERIRTALSRRGLQLVRDGIGRQFREPIIAALTSGEFDGQSPLAVAAALRKRFGAGEYNWERLTVSEIGQAQADGKLALMDETGIEQYDYVTVGDTLVSSICRSNKAGSPYGVTDPAGKRPVRDSHPGCRCTVRPKIPE